MVWKIKINSSFRFMTTVWVFTRSEVSEAKVSQLCLTLRSHGLWPTKFLCLWNSPGKNTRWVAISFSRGFSPPRDGTQVFCIAGRFFTVWASKETWVFTKVKWNESRSVVFDSLRPHGLQCPWNTPGQNTGVGSLSLLQGIFPIQG